MPEAAGWSDWIVRPDLRSVFPHIVMPPDLKFTSSAAGLVSGFGEAGQIVAEERPFQGYVERIAVREGLVLIRGRALPTDGPLSITASGNVPTDSLLLGCIFNGEGEIENAGRRDLAWRDPGQGFCVSLEGDPMAFHLRPGKPFEAMELLISPHALDFLGNGDLPEPVLRILNGETDPLAHVRPVTRESLQVARELFRPTYRGAMGALHRQAMAAAFIAHQFTGLDEIAREGSTLTSRELRLVREAQERLLANMNDPPDLSTLAASVDLAPKRLNQGFKEVFGTTVFDYLVEARLAAAQRMLDEGLDLPLKNLAWQLGYAHLSNFITAFRRRFGVSPGEYRRGVNSDASE